MTTAGMGQNVGKQPSDWQVQQGVHASPTCHTNVSEQQQQNAVQYAEIVQHLCQSNNHCHAQGFTCNKLHYNHRHAEDLTCNNLHCSTEMMLQTCINNHQLEQSTRPPAGDQEVQNRRQSYKLLGRQPVPALNLSAVKFGKNDPVAVLPEITQESCEAIAIKDAQLSLDDISTGQIQLHPAAPAQDRRCFVYQAVDTRVRPMVLHYHSLLPVQRHHWNCLW